MSHTFDDLERHRKVGRRRLKVSGTFPHLCSYRLTKQRSILCRPTTGRTACCQLILCCKSCTAVKVVMWSRGRGLTWRSQVIGANLIPIPTQLIWCYNLFGHKITLYRFSQGGVHTIAGSSNWSRGVSPLPPHFNHWSCITTTCTVDDLDDLMTYGNKIQQKCGQCNNLLQWYAQQL